MYWSKNYSKKIRLGSWPFKCLQDMLIEKTESPSLEYFDKTKHLDITFLFSETFFLLQNPLVLLCEVLLKIQLFCCRTLLRLIWFVILLPQVRAQYPVLLNNNSWIVRNLIEIYFTGFELFKTYFICCFWKRFWVSSFVTVQHD